MSTTSGSAPAKRPSVIFFLGDLTFNNVDSPVPTEIFGGGGRTSTMNSSGIPASSNAPTSNSSSRRSIRSPSALFTTTRFSFGKRKSIKNATTTDPQLQSRYSSLTSSTTTGVTNVDTVTDGNLPNTRSLSVCTDDNSAAHVTSEAMQPPSNSASSPQLTPRRSRGFSAISTGSPRALLESPSSLIKSFLKRRTSPSASCSSTSNDQHDEEQHMFAQRLERILGNNLRLCDDLVDQLLSAHSDGAKQCRFVSAVKDMEDIQDKGERYRRAKKIAEVFCGETSMFRLRPTDVSFSVISPSLPLGKLEPMLKQLKNLIVSQLLQNSMVMVYLITLTDAEIEDELEHVPYSRSYSPFEDDSGSPAADEENREHGRHQSSEIEDEQNNNSECKEEEVESFTPLSLLARQ